MSPFSSIVASPTQIAVGVDFLANADRFFFFVQEHPLRFTTQGQIFRSTEKAILEERIKYAKIYLEKYSQEIIGTTTKIAFVPSNQQKIFLLQSFKRLKSLTNTGDKDQIQRVVFECIKTSNIKPKEAFEVIYQRLTKKPFGPKIGELMIGLGFDKALSLLMIDDQDKTVSKTNNKYLYPNFNDAKIFSIDSSVSQKYPSINIGIAVIILQISN